MPSPFPGMDPFIESQVWPDFHNSLIHDFKLTLVPQLQPRYTVVTEQCVYLRTPDELLGDWRQVDAAVQATSSGPPASAATATLVAPVEVELPRSYEERELFLAIRHRDSGTLVTVIEVLSPSNRLPGSGRRYYLEKRDSVLNGETHLVEIDLVRSGRPLPAVGALPTSDYRITVSRTQRRPLAGVWPVGLQEPLPTIPVPLSRSDPDAVLDLQEAFRRVYDGSGYGVTLNYSLPVRPPLSPEAETWVEERLAAWRSARG